MKKFSLPTVISGLSMFLTFLLPIMSNSWPVVQAQDNLAFPTPVHHEEKDERVEPCLSEEEYPDKVANLPAQPGETVDKIKKRILDLDALEENDIRPGTAGVKNTWEIDRMGPQGPGSGVSAIPVHGSALFTGPLLRTHVNYASPLQMGGEQWAGHARVDPASLEIGASYRDQDHALGGKLFYMYGLPLVGFEGKWHMPARDTGAPASDATNSSGGETGEFLAVNAALPAWSDWTSLYAGANYKLSSGHSLYGAFNISPNQDRSVTYLGPYAGDDPQGQGLHGIRVWDRKGWSGFIDLGFFEPTSGIGLGVRTGVGQNKYHGYKTYLPLDQVQKYLRDGKRLGVTRIFRKLLKKGLPHIARPTQLKTGEEVSLSIERNLFFLLSAGVHTPVVPINVLKFGFLKDVTVEYRIHVRKLPQNKVEMKIQDLKVSNMSYFVRALILLGLTKTDILQIMDTQTLVFDLDQPQAQALYQDYIEGKKAPSFFLSLKKGPQHQNLESLLKSFQQGHQDLKDQGVTLKQMDSVNVPLKKYAISAKIFWIPPSLLPGLFYEKVHGQGQIMSVNGEAGLLKEVVLSHIQRGKFYKEDAQGVLTVVRKVSSAEEILGQVVPEVSEIKVLAYHHDNKATLASNNAMIHSLNSKFKTRLPPFETQVKGEHRTVNLEMTLRNDDLALLASLADEKLQTLQPSTGLSLKTLKKIRDLLGQGSSNEQMGKVQAFLQKHEWKGVRAIFHLLGADEKRISLSSESSVYNKALTKGRNFIIALLDPSAPFEAPEKVKFKIPQTSQEDKKLKKQLKLEFRRLQKAIDHFKKDPYNAGHFQLLEQFQELEGLLSTLKQSIEKGGGTDRD